MEAWVIETRPEQLMVLYQHEKLKTTEDSHWEAIDIPNTTIPYMIEINLIVKLNQNMIRIKETNRSGLLKIQDKEKLSHLIHFLPPSRKLAHQSKLIGWG